MALPSVNYAGIAPQGNSALANIVPLLVQGFKAGQLPEQTQLQNAHNALLNALLTTQNKYLPQEMQGDITGKNLQNQMLTTQNQYLPQQLQGEISGQNLSNQQKSITNQYLPGSLQNEQALQQAQLTGQNISNKYAPEVTQGKLALTKAMIQSAQNKAQFGNIDGSSPIGQAVQLQRIKNTLGENSPVYQAAAAAYTANARKYASPATKISGDLEDAKAGFVPGSARTLKLKPGDQSALVNSLGLAFQKATTDSGARQKSLYAQNIEKTLGLINPEDLTRYGGLIGTIAHVDNVGFSPIGLETSKYDRYLQQKALVNRLASQVRQFYGDSVMPSNVEKLLSEFNPAGLTTNQHQALAIYNTLKNVLHKETSTYTGSLKSTSPYEQRSNNDESHKIFGEGE